jgi:hypothetical protein
LKPTDAQQVARIFEDFPVLPGKPLVYFDSAATSKNRARSSSLSLEACEHGYA